MPKSRSLWARFSRAKGWQVSQARRRGKLIWRHWAGEPEPKAPQLLHKGRKP